jgi:hypothetical protein
MRAPIIAGIVGFIFFFWVFHGNHTQADFDAWEKRAAAQAAAEKAAHRERDEARDAAANYIVKKWELQRKIQCADVQTWDHSCVLESK